MSEVSLDDLECRLDQLEQRLEDLPQDDTGRAISDRFESIESKMAEQHIDIQTSLRRFLSLEESLESKIQEITNDTSEAQEDRIAKLEVEVYLLRESITAMKVTLAAVAGELHSVSHTIRKADKNINTKKRYKKNN